MAMLSHGNKCAHRLSVHDNEMATSGQKIALFMTEERLAHAEKLIELKVLTSLFRLGNI
jgi:hypothetical protein